MNVKFASAEQARQCHRFRNIKQKLHKTIAEKNSNNITVLENTTDTSHKVTRGCMCSDRRAPDDGHGGV
jgi:hypothetical protein